MKIRIKDTVNLEELRKFGFALGGELMENPEFEEILDGCNYMRDWWIKFQMDPDCPEKVHMTEEENPVCEAWVDTRDGGNYLWFDICPNCTYHCSMNDLDIITNTLLDLCEAGMIERVEN